MFGIVLANDCPQDLFLSGFFSAGTGLFSVADVSLQNGTWQGTGAVPIFTDAGIVCTLDLHYQGTSSLFGQFTNTSVASSELASYSPFPLGLQDSALNGPGSYTATSMWESWDGGAGTFLWLLPYVLTITNTTVAQTFVIKGEVIQPGDTAVFWHPDLQSANTTNGVSPFGTVDLTSTGQFISASQWPVDCYLTGSSNNPGKITDSSFGPGNLTSLNLTTFQASVYSAAPFMPSQSGAFINGMENSTYASDGAKRSPPIFTVPFVTGLLTSMQYPTAFPVAYFLTDNSYPDPDVWKGDPTSAKPTATNVWQPIRSFFSDGTPASSQLSVFSTLQGTVPVTVIVSDATSTNINSFVLASVTPSISIPFRMTSTITIVGPTKASIVFDPSVLPVTVLQAYQNIGGTLGAQNTNFAALPAVSPNPQLTGKEVLAGQTTDANSYERPDWWNTFSPTPPSPVLLTAADGSFTATAIVYSRNGDTFVNIVVRSGPVFKMYAHGQYTLGNLATPMPQTPGFAYSSGLTSYVASIVPNGLMSALEMSGLEDVLILELPTLGTPTNSNGPSVFFSAVGVGEIMTTLAQLQSSSVVGIWNLFGNRGAYVLNKDGVPYPVRVAGFSGGAIILLIGYDSQNTFVTKTAGTGMITKGDQSTFKACSAIPWYLGTTASAIYGYIDPNTSTKRAKFTCGSTNASTVPVLYGPDSFSNSFSSALPLAASYTPSIAGFVRNICGVPGFQTCRNVAGTVPASCLGAFAETTPTSASMIGQAGTTFSDICHTFCGTSVGAGDAGGDNPGIACRTIIADTCTLTGDAVSDAAVLADPACACALMESSTVPINVVAGQPMTYTQFVAWFTTNFKGTGVPAMVRDLQCWWPACQGVDAALTSFAPCPAALTECFSLVQQVSATNNSKVTIKLQNECGVQVADDNPVAQAPVPNALPSQPPASSQLLPIAIVASVTLIICLLLLSSTALVGFHPKKKIV